MNPAPDVDAVAAQHSPLLKNLNPEQLAAVTAAPEPALILAGAELKGRVNLVNPAKTLALLKAPKSP